MNPIVLYPLEDFGFGGFWSDGFSEFFMDDGSMAVFRIVILDRSGRCAYQGEGSWRRFLNPSRAASQKAAKGAEGFIFEAADPEIDEDPIPFKIMAMRSISLQGALHGARSFSMGMPLRVPFSSMAVIRTGCIFERGSSRSGA